MLDIFTVLIGHVWVLGYILINLTEGFSIILYCLSIHEILFSLLFLEPFSLTLTSSKFHL